LHLAFWLSPCLWTLKVITALGRFYDSHSSDTKAQLALLPGKALYDSPCCFSKTLFILSLPPCCLLHSQGPPVSFSKPLPGSHVPHPLIPMSIPILLSQKFLLLFISFLKFISSGFLPDHARESVCT
jgi:hypothetical protein